MKSRTVRLGKFCTHCTNVGHNVSDCWSIKRKESGQRSEENRGQPDLDQSPVGNQINVEDTRSGEILSLEDSMIREIVYSPQDAHPWVLDFGATFHVTPNIEWFLNYSVGTNNTIQLGNGQEWRIVGVGKVPIQLSNGNTIILYQVQHILVQHQSSTYSRNPCSYC